MEHDETPGKDPGGAKLKAWLASQRESTDTATRSEIAQMFDWLLRDLAFRMQVGLVAAVVGAGVGAAAFAFYGINWTLGLISGAAVFGFLGIAFAIGPFRR